MTGRVLSGIELPDPVWFKSSYSASENECVEVANLRGLIAVRDSKNPRGPVLAFPAAAFAAFVEGVRRVGR
ncbi:MULTISPECIES: DUF397 domain-containing protein [Streptomyces]|uniref:DUF397 domain-containing protein n=1 Tax=Streptomyces TaxID=1883 RepID=UPI00069B16D9|nr:MULTISPECIES: DUF397 domain-containing protein [Streptomyces]MYU54587.1 DUF397 domain-containing protein [Streptomyces sp. SID7805]